VSTENSSPKIDTFQIKSVSTKRFLRKTGSVPSTVLNEIKTAIEAAIAAD